MSNLPLRFPDDSQRHAIIGTTGSGKTVFGLWCLAHRSWTTRPWLLIDFKRDEHIAQLPHLERLRLGAKLPKQAGLYHIIADPDDVDSGAVTQLFRDVWRREGIGLYIDEGYEIPRQDRGLRRVLTQGRSLRIPVTALVQRPAWVSPWLLSECEYKSVFYVDTEADVLRLRSYGVRRNPMLLPDHHSYWHQRQGRVLRYLGPCPPISETLDIFDARRPVRRSWFFGL